MKTKSVFLVIVGAIVACVVAFCKWSYEIGTSGIRSKK